MRQIQGKNIVGYVTIQITGKQPEAFFQDCATMNIPVWDIYKMNTNQCEGKVYFLHVHKVTKLAKNSPYKLVIVNRKGSINYVTRLWKRKEILLSIILCSVVIFFMSNIIWKVNISGISTELEDKLNEHLTTYGLHEGAWIYSLESVDIIQQKILNEVPELLYIGIEKKGTTYHIDAVEKLIVKEEESKPDQHLIAAKNGIVQKMFLKKGVPTVNINDYVVQGDLLVSGTIEEEKEVDEEKSNEKKIISAEGKVYANTWYEVNVTSSLYHSKEKFSGEQIRKYMLNIGNIQLPIWGFKKIPFAHSFEETETKPLYFIKWELPISIVQRTIYDKEFFSDVKSEEEAKEIAIQQVKNDLQLKLGSDAKILKYYVLHETVDSGKVKLNLYISVLENIAKGKSIS